MYCSESFQSKIQSGYSKKKKKVGEWEWTSFIIEMT